MNRHRFLPREIAHASGSLSRRSAEQYALACAACDLDEDALCVSLAGTWQSGQKHERPGPYQFDDAPLFIRDLGRQRPRTCSEEPTESPLKLPEPCQVDPVSLDDEVGGGNEASYRGLEQVDVADLQEPCRRLRELVREKKGVAVVLCLFQHVADTGAQPVPVVELEPERSSDPIGDLEADSRQLRQPIRVLLEQSDNVSSVTP